MKYIQILNNPKLINTITRVSNEIAAEMVHAGKASYTSKA
jgi:hypothetical protein